MGSCRTTAIRSGWPICNSFISTSSIRHGAQIVLLTTSVDLPWLHSPLWSICMDMWHLSGPKFFSKIRTSPPPIISWVHARMSPIFTFRTDCYAIWAISVFFQVSVQILFGKSTTVGWQDILAWRKLWSFYRNILLAKTSIGRQQVYHIFHCMCHFQDNHQEARLIHPSSYSRESLGIHLDGLHVYPFVHQARKWLCICGSWSDFEDGHP
jgi:hypothetical protein